MAVVLAASVFGTVWLWLRISGWHCGCDLGCVCGCIGGGCGCDWVWWQWMMVLCGCSCGSTFGCIGGWHFGYDLGCSCIGGWHCGEGEGQFVNGDRVAANDQTILVNGVAGVNHQIIAIL